MRRLAFVVITAMSVIATAVPASAHPIPHPGPPVVRNLRPASGEVVEDGPVTVAAQVVCDVPITGWTLQVDGTPVHATSQGADPSHPTIVGDPVTLQPGEHVAQLNVTGSDGRTGGRAWRISASGLHARRLAGADRVQTAVAVSRDLYPDGTNATAAVLARRDAFADALAGAPLAQKADGPVLLTDRASLSSPVADELHRLLHPGATVYLLGGPDALSPQVEADVTAAGFAPRRLAGTTRAATATAVATELGTANGAIVVNGDSFPDALSASSAAAAGQLPVLLTSRDTLPLDTSQFLATHPLTQLTVVGGESAVAASVVTQLTTGIGTATLTRVSGADRWATAVTVAQKFFPTSGPVVLASGTTFPDALSGGRRAAALHAPLLLSPPDGLPDADAVAALKPTSMVVLGGPAALSDNVAGDLRRAVYDGPDLHVTDLDPAPGSEINDLQVFSAVFDHTLDISASSISVMIDGEEVPGPVSAGELNDTLLLNPTARPVTPPADQPVDVRVVVAAFDGNHWRHLEQHLVYRRVAVTFGESGATVAQIQERLLDLGYWLDRADGQFGSLTQQAIYAFQKVQGLPRTGVADAATRAALAIAGRPLPRTPTGRLVEVDKARQVVFLVNNGHVDWIFNTSTGSEQPYTVQGRTSIAHTPTGSFTILRQVDGQDDSPLGILWRPKYFTADGVALHGALSVPPYPASHGCVRLTNAAMDWLWATNRLPLGTRVLVS